MQPAGSKDSVGFFLCYLFFVPKLIMKRKNVKFEMHPKIFGNFTIIM